MSVIYNVLKGFSKLTTSYKKIAQDIIMFDFLIVNAFIIYNINNNKNEWVLVDTGLESSANYIIKTAEKLFGESTKPKAIILTHGHFDHIGSIKQLIDKWNVPIYAHVKEMPYLTGEKDYPKPDPTVDSGLVSKMSPEFPHSSIDISSNLVILPSDGSIPFLPNWKYIHTPGHSPGHISLYNSETKVLIAGDAFTTLKQESLFSVITKSEEIHGPPAYLTPDWESSLESIIKLSKLDTKKVLLSHGKPLKQDEIKPHFNYLITNFDDKFKPKDSKYL